MIIDLSVQSISNLNIIDNFELILTPIHIQMKYTT